MTPPEVTLQSLAFEYYGTYEGWRAIAEANGLRDWGATTPLKLNKRFAAGANLKIPQWSPTTAKQLGTAATTSGTLGVL